jgi:hypothetical protein
MDFRSTNSSGSLVRSGSTHSPLRSPARRACPRITYLESVTTSTTTTPVASIGETYWTGPRLCPYERTTADGIFNSIAFDEMTPSQWRQMLAVHLDGGSYLSASIQGDEEGEPGVSVVFADDVECAWVALGYGADEIGVQLVALLDELWQRFAFDGEHSEHVRFDDLKQAQIQRAQDGARGDFGYAGM